MSTILADNIVGGQSPFQITDTIAASATKVVDTNPVSEYRSVKWIITITDDTNDLVRGMEVVGNHRDGANPEHIIYATFGDKLKTLTEVKISGTDMVLEITNNETVTLQFDILKVLTVV